MKKIADFIVKFRYVFFGIILAAVIVCAVFIPKVNVNYDLTQYLPEDSLTLQALDKMEDEFGAAGSAQVMVEKIGPDDADYIKSSIEKIDGVSLVLLNDTKIDTDGEALFTVFLTESNYSASVKETIQNIRDALSGYELSMSGTSVDVAYMRDSISTDITTILLIAIAIIIVILTLSSSSWCDVIIFALVFGVAILINLGTNALFPNISFITQAICIIMQLALAMDYAIMLLHRFNEEKDKEKNSKKALSNALAKTFSPISASGLTTIAGLLALVFMQFTIGFDIGLVLAKGIVCSMVAVFLFMPCILLLLNPLLEKTKHPALASLIRKRFAGLKEKRAEKTAEKTKASAAAIPYAATSDVDAFPVISPPAAEPAAVRSPAAAASAATPKNIAHEKNKKRSFTGFQWSSRIPVTIVVVLLIVLGAVFNWQVGYDYKVSTAKNESASINIESAKIEDAFGVQNTLVILVPHGSRENEQKLADYVSGLEIDGEKMLNAGQAAVTIEAAPGVGLFTPLTAAQISAVSAMPQEIIGELFTCMAYSNGVQHLDAASLYDLLNFVSETKAAEEMGKQNQSEIDEIFAEITAAEFADTYSITINEATLLYGAYALSTGDLSEKVMVYNMLIFIHNSKILTTVGKSNMQTEIDALVTYLHSPVSLEEAIVQYGIDQSTLELIFSQMPVVQNIHIFEFICHNHIFDIIGKNIQTQINDHYALALAGLAIFDGTEYTRLIFNLNSDISSDKAFEVIDILRNSAEIKELYGDGFYIVSESANTLDMKTSFTSDNVLISLISLLAIFLVILLTFKSLSIPLILTLLIQGAIWLTMGMNFMFGSPIYFLCYIIITCIQLGATVDYAILLSDRYMDARKTLPPKDSMKTAFKTAVPTILTSGSIMFLAALTVGLVSQLTIVSALGTLLARGVATSIIFVVFALPQILLLCDKVIHKTTLQKKLFKKK